MRPRPTAVALLAVVLVAVCTGPASAATCYRYTEREQEFARLTNQDRAEAGLPSLRLDPHLSRVAARHSYWMSTLNRLYHSRRLGWKVTGWSLLGENVGVGSDLRELQAAFMASDPHRHNILRRGFTYFGVAVTRGYGRTWVTVIFESSADPGTRLPMPSC